MVSYDYQVVLHAFCLLIGITSAMRKSVLGDHLTTNPLQFVISTNPTIHGSLFLPIPEKWRVMTILKGKPLMKHLHNIHPSFFVTGMILLLLAFGTQPAMAQFEDISLVNISLYG
jgi:hypothetical protein